MYRRKGRILAGLLAMVLVFTSGGVSVLADETDDRAYTAGLCEHHPEHTDDCGYDEATGTPCTYECDICGNDASEGEKTDQNGSGQNTGSEDGQNTEDTLEDTTSGGAATAGDTADKTGTDETDNAAMITDWSWIDEDGILQENDGVWEIGVPGASEDNPLTQDALLEMLPEQINATLSDGSEVTVDLTWDLSEIPEEGVWSGEYTVSANVDGTYSVSEDVSALQVTVTAGGGENYASEANLANGRVEGISPQGTTINVFDYWQTDDADPAGDYESDRDHGINKNTVLKFGSGMATSSGDNATKENVNAYTSSEQVRQGIVNRSLTDGYPSLSDAVDDSRSSLEYLFSPSVAHEGKASYRDAEGLLQVDDEGYYYYDSIKTFAELDRETAKFTLYEGNYYSQKNEGKLGDGKVGGAVAAAGSSPDGQFFPFASASEVYKDAEDGNGISLNPDMNSKNATIQHYFGLTMSTRFVQQDGGFTDNTQKTAVTYEFSGDDDVWVFIDGVLVADLGGIHDRSSLKIDFSTGEIVINEGKGQYEKTSTLHKQFNDAGKESSTKWSEDDPDTFADGTYHTLNFYYLERGGSDSNMSLKFNLVSIPASGIIKVDQAGNYISGAEFVLYEANADYEYNKDDVVCRGRTDSNGELIFTKINDVGAEEPVSLGELYTQGIDNLVLAEETTPAGYRSFGEMHIRLAQSEGGEVFALSENQWDTGAYASGNVRVQADAELTVNKNGETKKVDAATGTLFAVVLQRQDTTKPINDASNWRAVYGDPLSGWHVVESSDGSGGNDTLAGIITAAKENPHIFTLQQSGSYDVDINDLPGDIETYYYVISGDTEKNAKTKYTVGYYFTKADSLSGATVENTYRVDSEEFDRIFSVNLYVPNIQNNLYVQKLDKNGQPVSAGADGSGSATFTLYSQTGVTIHKDGTYTVAEGTQSYSAATSDMTTPLPLTGGAMFTRIPNGTYYLIETKAPEGYEKSSEIIPVVVDNTGIYADAGRAKDDVSVQRGVGSIVHSMIQFATNDDIDATLHNIKADLYTAASGSGLPTDESGWKSTTENALHLQFQEGAETLNYREEDDSYGYFTIDEGWSKLKIYQCLDHNNTGSPREELEDDQELTNLFSGTVVVQVRNTSTGNLKISKDVVNNTGLDGTQTEFKFTLTGSVNRNPLNRTYNAVRTADGSTSAEAVVFNAGKAEITLEDRESIEIQGLPTDTKIGIVEETYPDYKTTYVIGTGQPAEGNGAEVIIPGNSSGVEVTYTNTYHVEGSFTFTKTGTAEEGSSPGPLEGATFAVYRLICTTPNEEGHDHKNQLISIADPDKGTVAAEDEGCWELVGTPMTSRPDGVITISGIPVIENTEYRLAELQAPPGFTVPTGQWKLYYDSADKVFKPKSGTGNDASIGNPPAIEEDETSGTIKYKIRNYRPGELPFSGNTGIRMFLIIGGALMLCGAAGGTGWYLYQRKAPAARRRRKR